MSNSLQLDTPFSGLPSWEVLELKRAESLDGQVEHGCVCLAFAFIFPQPGYLGLGVIDYQLDRNIVTVQCLYLFLYLLRKF